MTFLDIKYNKLRSNICWWLLLVVVVTHYAFLTYCCCSKHKKTRTRHDKLKDKEVVYVFVKVSRNLLSFEM